MITAALSDSFSAAGINAPTGAKIKAASSFSGGDSSELPAQTAPSLSANSWAFISPGLVKAKTFFP